MTVDLCPRPGWRFVVARRYGFWLLTPWLSVSWFSPRASWVPPRIRQAHARRRWGTFRVYRP